MGDHRASIKITMEFHGIVSEADWWINYSDGGSDVYGVDQRVIDFFVGAYEKGMSKYSDDMADYWAEKNAKEAEEKELKELERLKSKYDKPQQEASNE